MAATQTGSSDHHHHSDLRIGVLVMGLCGRPCRNRLRHCGSVPDLPLTPTRLEDRDFKATSNHHIVGSYLTFAKSTSLLKGKGFHTAGFLLLLFNKSTVGNFVLPNLATEPAHDLHAISQWHIGVMMTSKPMSRPTFWRRVSSVLKSVRLSKISMHSAMDGALVDSGSMNPRRYKYSTMPSGTSPSPMYPKFIFGTLQVVGSPARSAIRRRSATLESLALLPGMVVFGSFCNMALHSSFFVSFRSL